MGRATARKLCLARRSSRWSGNPWLQRLREREASAASSDFRSLLISLAEDLAAHSIIQKPDEFEQDANKFSEQIKALLSFITEPVVIFLDALDQLRKPYRFGWLPDALPPAVKVIVSVLEDEAYETDSGIYRTLRQRLPPDAFLEIEPLLSTQGRDILIALEREGRRRLQSAQRNYIIRQFEKAGASPLYLTTAFEIARSWRSTDTRSRHPVHGSARRTSTMAGWGKFRKEAPKSP